MKLNKKTIYRVKTQKLYNEMMEDCEKQGFRWIKKGDAKTHFPEKWKCYEGETCVRIDENGVLWYADVECYEKHMDTHGYEWVEYKNIPSIYPMGIGAVCIDAPNYEEAYQAFIDYINPLINTLTAKKPNEYTVRVEDEKTTVITPDGKMATAKCHPDDEFDVVEGFRVAMEKIKRQDIKLNQKEREILNAIVVLGGISFYINDEHYLIADFEDESVYVSIEEDDFKWCEEYEDYNVKELLEQCS